VFAEMNSDSDHKDYSYVCLEAARIIAKATMRIKPETADPPPKGYSD
jgi:hypothetical protein